MQRLWNAHSGGLGGLFSWSARREAFANSFVKFRDIFRIAEGQAAVDLQQRVQLRSGNDQGRECHLASGILNQILGAPKAAADCFSEIASP